MLFFEGGRYGKRGHCHGTSEGVEKPACYQQRVGEGDQAGGSLRDFIVELKANPKVGEARKARRRQYLPLYNRRFSVRPQGLGNLHRLLPKGFNLDSVLCIKTERTLRNDFTVAHNGKLYQIEDKTRAARVMVHEQIDGSIKILYQSQALRFGQITTRRAKQESPPVRVRRRTPHPPSPNHPWRNFQFGAHKYERREAILAANPLDGTGEETDKDQQTGPTKRRRGSRPAAGEIPVALRAPSISPANPGSE